MADGIPDGEFTRFDLGDGLALQARRDDRFTSTTVLAYVQRPLGPAAAETALLPSLLKSGTTVHPSIPALARACQELWGTSFDVSVGRAADRQVLMFRCEVPDGRFLPGEDPLPGAVRLLSEVMSDPLLERESASAAALFPAATVARERANLANWIRARQDDKATYASEQCAHSLFRGEPYAWHELGQLDDVAGCDPARVTQAYRTLLAGAQVDCFVVGGLDPAAARDLVAPHLALPRRGVATLARPALAPPRGEPVQEAIEFQPLEQGKLVMGWRSGITRADDDFAGAIGFGVVLGGTSVSRLFKTVREKHGMAYYCSAGFDAASGALFVASGIEGDNYAKVVELVQEQIRLLADEGPTAEELGLVKHRLVSSLEGSQDTPPALVAQHFSESVSGAPRTTAERIARVQGITPAMVQQAAQRFALDSVFFLAPEGSNAAPVFGGRS